MSVLALVGCDKSKFVVQSCNMESKKCSEPFARFKEKTDCRNYAQIMNTDCVYE